MPARTPLHVWICVSFFIVSVAATPLIGRLLRWPVAPPRTLAELTKLLSQDAPSLYVVPVAEHQPETGIYICTQQQQREQLMWLMRGSEVACKCKWQGVVYCERVNHFGAIEEHIIRSWGEHGMQIGELLFFGDPVLLRSIHELIRNHRANNSE